VRHSTPKSSGCPAVRLLIESVKPVFGRMRWIFGLAHDRRNELQCDEHVNFATPSSAADLAQTQWP
jgi:hypothetical protein